MACLTHRVLFVCHRSSSVTDRRQDGTLGLGRCLRPLPGFRILGRVALETLLDCLVEKHVSGRAAQAATSDDNRIGKGSRPLFTRRRRRGISAVLTRHKRFENSTARISPRKRRYVQLLAGLWPSGNHTATVFSRSFSGSAESKEL